MNVEALPHTLLLLLAEMAVGGIWVVAVLNGRGLVPPGFVRVCVASIWLTAGLAWWIAVSLSAQAEVAGYPLDSSVLAALRWSAFAVFALSFLWTIASLVATQAAQNVVGIACSVAGLVLLLYLAAYVSPATWSYAGMATSAIAGAMAAGGVSIAMILGHWYLVAPGLPSRPLDITTLGLLLALLLQSALLAVHLAVAPGQLPPALADAELFTNPAFWLRVLVLGFPIVLTFMAWRSSRAHVMQAATGLLYIAMGAVLCGELLARGLLFISGRPL